MADSEIKTGCQVDFDRGEAVLSGRYIDDIRNTCSELNINFEVNHKCYFTRDSQCYFTYKGVDWVPCSCKESVTSNNNYAYNIQAYPKFYYDFIKDASQNTKSLANSFGMESTDDFENIELTFPLRNEFASNLIKEYRKQSFQEAYKKGDMSSALLLYMHGSQLLSLTFGKWMNFEALNLQMSKFQSESSKITFYDEQSLNDLLCYRSASYWRGGDYLQRMFGKVFEISGTSAFIFLRRYTLKLSGSNEFDSDETYMCVRYEEELGKPDGFCSTFAEIKYVG